MHRPAIASVLLLVPFATAQEPVKPAPAERLVKLLELEAQRDQASMDLWRLGKAAVPALVRALRDPRDEIVEAAAAVLAEIGLEATSAAKDVERLLPEAKGRRLRALQWALHGVSEHGFALAEWSRGQITLLDERGKATGKISVQKNVWDVQPLPGGRWLVTEANTGKVREVDVEGKELWSVDVANAHRAQRLPGGNTLVACAQRGGVVEFDPAGKVVWEHKDVRAEWCRRLLNGHTLVLDHGKNVLLEVDRKGNVVSSHDVGAEAYGAMRLPGGNTMVVSRQRNKVLELDSEGKEVRSLEGVTVPNACLRIGDGVTLVACQGEVVAFDSDGKVLWRHGCELAGSVSR